MTNNQGVHWFYKLVLLSVGLVSAFLSISSLVMIPSVIDLADRMHYQLWNGILISFVVPVVILVPLCILDFVYLWSYIKKHNLNRKRVMIISISNALIIALVLFISNSPDLWLRFG